jgi:hypothetical protein
MQKTAGGGNLARGKLKGRRSTENTGLQEISLNFEGLI